MGTGLVITGVDPGVDHAMSQRIGFGCRPGGRARCSSSPWEGDESCDGCCERFWLAVVAVWEPPRDLVSQEWRMYRNCNCNCDDD